MANFLNNPDGETGEPSEDLMLTLTGLFNGSCLTECFSGGGPIGLSSRFRFFFFSCLERSPELLRLLLELDDFLSLFSEDEEVLLIGVIVIDEGTFGPVCMDNGMISMRGRFSSMAGKKYDIIMGKLV